MEIPRRSRLGWTGAAASLLVALAALVHVDSNRLADPDLFVTLYSGAEIALHGGVPGIDTVTFSIPGQPWVDYEWGARLLFYRIHQTFGSAGLVGLRLALVLGLLAALYGVSRRHARGPLPFALTVPLLVAAAGPYFVFRPTLLTFFLLALWLLLTDLVHDGTMWPLAMMPPLLCLWLNLHGGFGLGVLLMAVLLAESAMERSLTRTLRVALSFLACLVLTGFNPYGYGIWKAIFGSLGGEIAGTVSQGQPLFALGLGQRLPVLLLLGVAAAILVRARRWVRLFDVLPVAVLALAAFLRVPSVPLFSIVASAVILRLLPLIEVPAWWARLREQGLRWQRGATVALPLAGVAVIWLVEGVPHGEILLREWLTPVGGIKFLEANGIVGPMNVLNEYDWGGYIRWRLPQARIFVDGRADTVYPPAVTREWAAFVHGFDGAYALPDRFGADVIFLFRPDPVVARLEKDDRWIQAYTDDNSTIFLRDSQANQEHLARLREGRATAPTLTEEDYLLDSPKPGGGT